MQEKKRTAVIGSGPAGLTAAIYLARANLAPTIFAGTTYGGQLMITTDVENYPGFPEGIMGPDLMQKLIDQAKRFGAEIVYKDVTKVDFSKQPFTLFTDQEAHTFDGVVVATGASSKMLGLESEMRLTGRGVSYCATCDGAFFKNKVLAVVGGGDSAMEEAIFLTRFATKVYILHRREAFRASAIMQQKALSNPKIEAIYNVEVQEIHGESKVEKITLKNIQTQELSTLTLDGVFVAIGHSPNTEIFKGQLDLDENGYIMITKGTKTSVDGVFTAGDVDDHRYKQAITAAGEGCKAALDLEKYLAGITL